MPCAPLYALFAYMTSETPATSPLDATGAPGDLPQQISRLRDQLHIPSDAGVYRDGLERMLRRIPDGWGRWVSCDFGWYALLVSLDAEIAAVAPDYEIHQMKEKFGTLRFYWNLPDILPECCIEREARDPRPAYVGLGARPALPPQDDPTVAYAAWQSRHEAHLQSAAHADGVARLGARGEDAHRDEVRAIIDALVTSAEHRSAATCERCAGDGSLRHDGYWVKTLCDTCAVDFCAGEREHADDDDAD